MFAERFRELRIQRHYTRTDIAKVLNVTTATIGNYELGNREPGIRELLLLAEFFDVSLDYLVGRTDISVKKHKGRKITYAIIESIEVPGILTNGEIDMIVSVYASGKRYCWIDEKTGDAYHG